MNAKKWIRLIFFLLFFFGYCPSVSANVTIGPNQLNYLSKPGRESSQTVEIKNQSDLSFRVRVDIIDAVQESGKLKFLNAGETPYSCAAWTTVTPSELPLGPMETQTVTVKVKPESGARGSYHGALMFVVSPVVESDAKYRVSGQIGAVVLTSVFIEGTLQPKLEIRDAVITQATPIRNVSMNMSPQPTAVVSLENTGNCMVSVQGEFVVRLADSNRRVASGSILSINYPMPPTLPPGVTLPIFIPLDRSVPNGSYLGVTKFIYGKRSRLSAKIPVVVGDLSLDSPEIVLEQLRLDFNPKMLDVRLRPGAKRSSSVSLINLEKNDVHLEAKLFPLALTSDGQPQIGAYPPEVPPIAEYLEIKHVPEQLKSGQKGRLVVMAQMPSDTDMPGLGVIRLKAVDPSESEAKESFFYYPVLVSSEKAEPARVEIETMDYLPAPNEQSPDRVVLTIQNTSTNYGFVKGQVEIREEAGYVYGNQSYGYEETILLLPYGKREIEILLKEKERLKSGTDYILTFKTDIYEESIKRRRRILKILNRSEEKAKFIMVKDAEGALSIEIKDKSSEAEKQPPSGETNN